MSYPVAVLTIAGILAGIAMVWCSGWLTGFFRGIKEDHVSEEWLRRRPPEPEYQHSRRGGHPFAVTEMRVIPRRKETP